MERSHDDADVEYLCEELERAWGLGRRRRRWPPLSRRVEGVEVIDLVAVAPLRELPAEHRVLLLVLGLAVKDRASEVRFVPCRRGGEDDSDASLEMCYAVDGEFIELVPPPWDAWIVMWRELERIAGLRTRRRWIADRLRRLADRIDGQKPLPRLGHFRLAIGDESLDVKVTAYPYDPGEYVILELSPASERASHRAWWEMNRVMDERQERAGPDGPPPETSGTSTPGPGSACGEERGRSGQAGDAASE